MFVLQSNFSKNKPLKIFKQGDACPVRRRWIRLCQSHIGKHGNNEVDKTAKSEHEIVKIKISSKDLKHLLNST